MIRVILLGIAYAKVVGHEIEHDVASDVLEQTWGVGALDVVVGAEVPD